MITVPILNLARAYCMNLRLELESQNPMRREARPLLYKDPFKLELPVDRAEDEHTPREGP